MYGVQTGWRGWKYAFFCTCTTVCGWAHIWYSLLFKKMYSSFVSGAHFSTFFYSLLQVLQYANDDLLVVIRDTFCLSLLKFFLKIIIIIALQKTWGFYTFVTYLVLINVFWECILNWYRLKLCVEFEMICRDFTEIWIFNVGICHCKMIMWTVTRQSILLYVCYTS